MSSADFFSKLTFEKILSGIHWFGLMLYVLGQQLRSVILSTLLLGIQSECQTAWILIRPDDSSGLIVGPDLGPNCLPRLSADGTGRQRVNEFSCVKVHVFIKRVVEKL